jgi:hypothetical protein
MNRLFLGVILFSFSVAVNAADCVNSDLAGHTWYLYSSQDQVLFCKLKISGRNKASGFCKSAFDVDNGSQTKIDKGTLKISNNCSVTGSFTATADEVSSIFGAEDIAVKLSKARMNLGKDSLQGLMIFDGGSIPLFAFTAVRE